jgi:excisionase family DNA binding protein
MGIQQLWCDIEPLMTSQEICSYLDIGQMKLTKMIKAGEIKGFKIGKSWRIYKHELLNYMKRVAGD